jgi:hypothetical protein
MKLLDVALNFFCSSGNCVLQNIQTGNARIYFTSGAPFPWDFIPLAQEALAS